jgi:hypothetical protein
MNAFPTAIENRLVDGITTSLNSIQRDANQIGGVPRSEFSHQVGAMDLKRACADPQLISADFVGSAADDYRQYLVLARRQRQLVGGKRLRRGAITGSGMTVARS